MKFKEAQEPKKKFFTIYFKVTHPESGEQNPEQGTQIQADTKEEAIKKFNEDLGKDFNVTIISVEDRGW